MPLPLNNKGISRLLLIIFLVSILSIILGLIYFKNLSQESVKSDSTQATSDANLQILSNSMLKQIKFNPYANITFSAYATPVYPVYDHVVLMIIENANEDFIETFNSKGLFIEDMNGNKSRVNVKLNSSGKLRATLALNMKTVRSLEFVGVKGNVQYLESSGNKNIYTWKVSETIVGLERGPGIENQITIPEPDAFVTFSANAWQFPSYDQVIIMNINANQRFREIFNQNGIVITNTDGSKRRLSLSMDSSLNIKTEITLNLKKTKSLEFVGLKPNITYLESNSDLSTHYWKINASKNGLERGPAKIN